ncbi:MAG TPA: NAD(+)/NADH kinase [Candidatus Acidoferrales bacterium]|nr:NAD(+)/NADH kinase [Candidatus Acidoferrales bacterium]
MRLGFAVNPTIPAALDLRERARRWCDEARVERWDVAAEDSQRLIEGLPGTDVLVVLGGDGTLLRAAHAVAAAEADVPILGVNLGKVGFLSKAEAHELEQVLARVLDGDYVLEDRMVLEVRVLPGGRDVGGRSFVALNDAAIVRAREARVVRLEVTIDGSHLATYVADGVIVATPTGSTGYSFSAGGPILDPTSRNLVVTSVAAYLSAVRSVVVGPQHTVRVQVLAAIDILVSIDGHEDVLLTVGDVVEVRARRRPVRFVEPRGAPAFWDLLREKAQLLPS